MKHMAADDAIINLPCWTNHWTNGTVHVYGANGIHELYLSCRAPSEEVFCHVMTRTNDQRQPFDICSLFSLNVLYHLFGIKKKRALHYHTISTLLFFLQSVTMTFLRSTVVAALLLSSVNAFHVTSPPEPATRRELLTNALIFATALTANQKEAEASGRGYHISRKLKAKEAKLQESVLSLKLPSGVAIQQIRDGRSGFGMFCA